jgi:integrase
VRLLRPPRAFGKFGDRVECLPPRERELEPHVPSPGDPRRVVDRATGVYRMPIAFAIYTGCRQSEISGLRRTEFDCNRSAAHIRRRYTKGEFAEPKSATSTRVVEIPAEFLHDLEI